MAIFFASRRFYLPNSKFICQMADTVFGCGRHLALLAILRP